MKQGCKVMDSDMHIIELPDLWQRYIEPGFKEQAPRGATNSVADLGMVGPDGTPGGRNPTNVQNLGQNRRHGHSGLLDQLERPRVHLIGKTVGGSIAMRFVTWHQGRDTRRGKGDGGAHAAVHRVCTGHSAWTA